MLEIAVERNGDTGSMSLTGELRPLPERAVRAASSTGSPRRRSVRSLTLDMQGLRSIDPAGLDVIRTAWESAGQSGVDAILVRASSEVRFALEESGLDRVLPVIYECPDGPLGLVAAGLPPAARTPLGGAAHGLGRARHQAAIDARRRLRLPDLEARVLADHARLGDEDLDLHAGRVEAVLDGADPKHLRGACLRLVRGSLARAALLAKGHPLAAAAHDDLGPRLVRSRGTAAAGRRSS